MGPVNSFEGLCSMGIDHFQKKFRARKGSSIVEIVQVDRFFPCFVEEEDNMMLMDVVIEDDIGAVLHSFQKDKSLGLDRWPVEFYLGFLGTLGSDLLKVVEESRISGMIHGPINSTFIAIILK